MLLCFIPYILSYYNIQLNHFIYRSPQAFDGVLLLGVHRLNIIRQSDAVLHDVESMGWKGGDNQTELKIMQFVFWNKLLRTKKCTSKKWFIIVVLVLTIFHWVMAVINFNILHGYFRTRCSKNCIPCMSNITCFPASFLHASHSQKRQMTVSPSLLLHRST